MSRSTLRRRALAVFVVALALLVPAAAAQAAKPTIVLVHGAFADASSWNRVTPRLQARGYKVLAPANPLRGVSADAQYLRGVLSHVEGPIVLVGHSYGGVAITNAATGNPNVKAVVYVAAFAPDQGDTVASLGAMVPGGMLGPATLDLYPYAIPGADPQLEGTIKPGVFHRVFAADVSKRFAALMAASQRPASLLTLGEPTGEPAWRTIPSWYMVAGKDLAIGTALERFMAERMDAATVEVKGASHVVMLSKPQRTTKLILDAVKGRR